MMGAAVERLTGLADAPHRFAIPHAELRDAQVAAMNERFQERKDRIKLLGHRANEAGISEIRSREEMVPLLFPHTAYKSYPESFLVEKKWDRLAKWLGTVSPYPITPVETAGVDDIDTWLDLLAARGHFVSCSSGTTGKSAMLLASEADMAWTRRDTVNIFAWGSGVQPAADRRIFGLAPIAHVPKNVMVSKAHQEAYGDPRSERFDFPVPPLTVGRLTDMVALRKAIAEGTARPEQIATFERTSQEREALMEKAYVLSAEAIVAARADKLHVMGMWSSLYQVAKLVREMGYSGKDFHPDNSLYVGGGLKRAQLPLDYQHFVHETFSIPHHHNFQNYSMQELNSGMPRCQEGERYHVPPWVIPLILDEEGTELLPHTRGELEGRAAFVDLSLDGRWGGVITGDKITLDLDPCPCGSAGPTIRDNIVRYADLAGDDKIGCAGTVDAYVRGMA